MLFPIALWWFSCFYFFGRWGKYSDDYFFGFRDPVTGAADWSRNPFMFDFFWRPLHFLFTNTLQTIFWYHQWALHLLNAAVHGLVALGIWQLLRRIGATSRAAAVGPLLFLVLPIQYDVVFWPAALSTGIAALLWLYLAKLFLRYVGFERGHAALAGMMLLAFAVPCFNEQASTGVIALPLLVLVAERADRPGRERVRRVLAASVLCVLMVGLYAGLLIGTAPPWARGSTQSIIAAGDLLPRLQEFAAALRATLTVSAIHLARGSFKAGWMALATPIGAAAFAGLGLAAGLWLRWFTKKTREAFDEGRPLADLLRTRTAALVFAAVVWVAAWVPLVLVADQRLPPRVLYFPDIGLALFFGVLADALMAVAVRWRAGSVLRPLLGVPTVAVALVASVSMVGFQAVLKERSAADHLQARRLKELVPDPPPETVFTPLADHYRPAQTGNNILDRMPGWLGQLWMVEPMVRHTFRRKDLFGTNLNNWFPLPLVDPDREGLRYDYRVVLSGFEAHPKGGTRIRWEQMVPFTVEGRSDVRLVRRLIVEMPDHRDLDVRFPIVERQLSSRALPTKTFLLPDTSAPAGARQLEGWRRADSGDPIALETVKAWGATRRAVVRLDPRGRAGAASIRLGLPPHPQPTRLFFRATLSDSELRNCLGCAGPTLRWSLSGAEESTLFELHLSRAGVSKEQKWLPVTIDLPARSRDAVLGIHAELELEGEEAAAALVTAGWGTSSPFSEDASVAAER